MTLALAQAALDEKKLRRQVHDIERGNYEGSAEMRELQVQLPRAEEFLANVEKLCTQLREKEKKDGQCELDVLVSIRFQQEQSDGRFSTAVAHFVDIAGRQWTGSREIDLKPYADSAKADQGPKGTVNTLRRCLDARVRPKPLVVPVDASPLTSILNQSLGGTGRLAVVACLSDRGCNVPATLYTMKFAAKTRRLRNNPVARVTDSWLVDHDQNTQSDPIQLLTKADETAEKTPDLPPGWVATRRDAPSELEVEAIRRVQLQLKQAQDKKREAMATDQAAWEAVQQQRVATQQRERDWVVAQAHRKLDNAANRLHALLRTAVRKELFLQLGEHHDLAVHGVVQLIRATAKTCIVVRSQRHCHGRQVLAHTSLRPDICDRGELDRGRYVCDVAIAEVPASLSCDASNSEFDNDLLLRQALSAVFDAMATSDAFLEDTTTEFSTIVLTMMALQEGSRQFLNSILLPQQYTPKPENKPVCCIRHHGVNLPNDL
eukprot:TRINITY_DN14188_c0_g1_i1.p1 TRINITY_DN14188_c0_g1~~TRINITY_DN14188_c0_g1_i1.p1  ORF type:complete len:490 (+),score=96.59 TRINITY_DN14188_c0_g1_i1:183-1652(+)